MFEWDGGASQFDQPKKMILSRLAPLSVITNCFCSLLLQLANALYEYGGRNFGAACDYLGLDSSMFKYKVRNMRSAV